MHPTPSSPGPLCSLLMLDTCYVRCRWPFQQRRSRRQSLYSNHRGQIPEEASVAKLGSAGCMRPCTGYSQGEALRWSERVAGRHCGWLREKCMSGTAICRAVTSPCMLVREGERSYMRLWPSTECIAAYKTGMHTGAHAAVTSACRPCTHVKHVVQQLHCMLARWTGLSHAIANPKAPHLHAPHKLVGNDAWALA